MRFIICVCFFFPFWALAQTADQAATLIAEGERLYKRKDYTKAQQSFEKAVPLLKQENDEYRLGQVLKQIGDLYAVRSYFRQSADHYREAISYLKKTNQHALVGDCSESLASINVSFGYSARAVDFYERALAMKTKLDDRPGMARMNLILAKLHFSEKNYETALSYNHNAAQLIDNEDNANVICIIQEAVILTFLGKIEEAKLWLSKADGLVANQKNSANHGKLLSAKYTYCLAVKDKTGAEVFLDSARVLLKNTGNPELAVEAFAQIAEINHLNGDYEAAYKAMINLDRYKDVFRTENIARISAEINEAADAALREKEIASLNLANQLNTVQLDHEKTARLALMRESVLKDSAFAHQSRLLTVLESESNLRADQLIREKELSLSLSRENELKRQLLSDEKRTKTILYSGILALAFLTTLILYLYYIQHIKNQIIKKQSNELNILNREIHHRVKNNLQVISSMLDLQAQTLRDKNAKNVMKEATARIQSMAFIHQNLYQDDAANTVNMGAYIQNLATHLFQTYHISAGTIQLKTDIEPLKLHTDSAIPMGMILNELIGNALKYAFKNRDMGTIEVVLKQHEHGLFLQVKDDGIGMPTDFSPDHSPTFGYEIIRAFAQKLRARLVIQGENGTDVQLFISKYNLTT